MVAPEGQDHPAEGSMRATNPLLQPRHLAAQRRHSRSVRLHRLQATLQTTIFLSEAGYLQTSCDNAEEIIKRSKNLGDFVFP